MKGKIVLINNRREMAALITERGEYTSFDTRGSDVEIGNIISGDLESVGFEEWLNETNGEKIEVFVEDICGARETALRMIS